MIVEKALQDFWEIIRNNEYARKSDTLAICLLIPGGMLNDLRKAEKEKDLIVQEGAKICSCLTEGIFARVSWTTYYGLTNGETEDVKKVMMNAIKQSVAINQNYGVWQVVVAPLETVLKTRSSTGKELTAKA
ncbi:MAG TPA: hypothetical protein VFV38_43275 [Ktedonobacteraceae bacterium]|nr:hypothetical protein [Ktedonobacteraceae bacterium]